MNTSEQNHLGRQIGLVLRRDKLEASLFGGMLSGSITSRLCRFAGWVGYAAEPAVAEPAAQDPIVINVNPGFSAPDTRTELYSPTNFTEVIAQLTNYTTSVASVMQPSNTIAPIVDLNSIEGLSNAAKRQLARRPANFDELDRMADISPVDKLCVKSYCSSPFTSFKAMLQGLYKSYHGLDADGADNADLNAAIELSGSNDVVSNPVRTYAGMLLVVKRLGISLEHVPAGGIFNRTRLAARHSNQLRSLGLSSTQRILLAPIINNNAMAHQLFALAETVNTDVLHKLVNGEDLTADDLLVNDIAFTERLSTILPDSPFSRWISRCNNTEELNTLFRELANHTPKILAADNTLSTTVETAQLLKALPPCLTSEDAAGDVKGLMAQLSDCTPAPNLNQNIRTIDTFVKVFDGYEQLFASINDINEETLVALRSIVSGNYKAIAAIQTEELAKVIALLGPINTQFERDGLGNTLLQSLALAVQTKLSSGNLFMLIDRLLESNAGSSVVLLLGLNTETQEIAKSLSNLTPDNKAALSAYIREVAAPWNGSEPLPVKAYKSAISAAWVFAQADEVSKKALTDLNAAIKDYAYNTSNSNLTYFSDLVSKMTQNTTDQLANFAISMVPPPTSLWRTFRSVCGWLLQFALHDKKQATLRLAGVICLGLFFAALSVSMMHGAIPILSAFIAFSLGASLLLLGVTLVRAFIMSKSLVKVQKSLEGYMFEQVLGLNPSLKKKFHSVVNKVKNSRETDLYKALQGEISELEVHDARRVLLASYALSEGLLNESNKPCALLENHSNLSEKKALEEFYTACLEKSRALREDLMSVKVDLSVIGVPLLGKLISALPSGAKDLPEIWQWGCEKLRLPVSANSLQPSNPAAATLHSPSVVNPLKTVPAA